jgi:hypothetical protein
VVGGYTVEGEPTYDPSITILDGFAFNRVLHCTVRGSLVISSLTIQNGLGEGTRSGAGLFVTHLPRDPTPGFVFIANNIIQDNHTNEKGGGVYAESFAPEGQAGNIWLIGNKISENTAEGVLGGGGAHLWINTGSISRSTGQILVIGNTISKNSAAGGAGGGVRVWSRSDSGPAGKVWLSRNTISDNSAEGFSDEGGGGLYIESQSEEGLSSSDPSSLNSITLEENFIANNSVGIGGGGVHVRTTSEDGIAAAITFEKNTISLNTAADNGGAVRATSTSVSGKGGDVTFSGNMVSKNSAGNAEIHGQAGGIRLGSSSFAGSQFAGEVILTNNMIVENISNYLDGGLLVSGNVTLTNNTIAKNEADERGGGATLFGALFVKAYNNIIWGNSAPLGADIVVQLCGSRDGFNNNYSDMAGWWTSEGGNINQDPLFVGLDDYHIQFVSPCKDAGTAGAPYLPPDDYDGEDRTYGSAPDMGADEIKLTLKPGSFPDLPLWKLLLPEFHDYIRPSR